MSPIKFTKFSQTAPLNIIKRKSLLDAVGGGIFSGIGSSENNVNDYAPNIGGSVVGNYAGYKSGEKFFGRGYNRPFARAVMSGVSDKIVSTIHDIMPKGKK